jgi:hypothetical protein
MFKIVPWYNNYQAPAVLMIDDLSDAYIEAYPESYKNDWGYLGEQEGSAYHFLEQSLLKHYPKIKITFFVPYLRHGIINAYSGFIIKKHALGERECYTDFLKKLTAKGHEIAHHGSNHGKYIDPSKCDVGENWIHEWATFKTVDEGSNITHHGIELFKQIANIAIIGGKYCGYIAIDNSQKIIDRCNFLYWCEKGSYQSDDTCFFGINQIFSFPTSFAGNSFIRLSYRTGDPKRDRKKQFMKYLQPLYTLLSYYKLYQLYKHRKIISIQEHISPSTTWGTVQSSNIITDCISLNKIFAFLKPRNVWYATCAEITTYLVVKNNTSLEWDAGTLTLHFNNTKNLTNTYLSLSHEHYFVLKQSLTLYRSEKNNGLYTVTVPITTGNNIFEYSLENH